MNKLIQSFITVEKSIQIFTIVGVILFLGYTVFTSYQINQKQSVPVISLTTQQ